VAQLVGHLALDFGSGRGLGVVGSSHAFGIALSLKHSGDFSFSLSLCRSPPKK